MRKNNTTKFYVGSPVTNALLVRLPNAIKEKGASIIYEFRQRPFADEVAYFDTKEIGRASCRERVFYSV